MILKQKKKKIFFIKKYLLIKKNLQSENIQMKKKRKFSTKKMKLGRNKKIHKKKESIINLGKII